MPGKRGKKKTGMALSGDIASAGKIYRMLEMDSVMEAYCEDS